jgi:small subunit ribosomal protein S16
MLIIRLQRTGSRNSPDFRLVLAEKHRAAAKKTQEIFGQYNPKTKVLALRDKDLLLAWVNKNVELSPTAHNLLINQKLIEGKKVKAWHPKRKEKPATSSSAAPVEKKPEAEKPAEAPAPAPEKSA